LYPKIKAPTYIDDSAADVEWAFKNIEEYGGDPTKIFVFGHLAVTQSLILQLEKKEALTATTIVDEHSALISC